MIAMVEIGKKYPTIDDKSIKKLIPTRNTVRKDVEDVSSEMISKIKLDIRNAIEFSGGFGVTTDFWTDDQKKYNYLSVTAHINLLTKNEINTKRYTLALKSVEAIKKTKEICLEEILKIFENYDLSMDEVKNHVTFVTDRGSNIRAALKEFSRLNCYGHLSNNIVVQMCKIEPVAEIVEKASKLVKYFKSSTLNSKLTSTLKSFSPTRFNTVYYTLLSVHNMYSEVVSVLNEKEDTDPSKPLLHKITDIPKFKLKEICDFLEPFMKLSKDIEGDKYYTLYKVVFAYHKIGKLLEYQSDDTLLVSGMKNNGRTYFDKNLVDFEPKLSHKIALFLHPMSKNLKKFTTEEKSEIHTNINSFLKQKETNAVDLPIDTSDCSSSKDYYGISDFIDSDGETSNTETISNELEQYISFKIKTTSDVDSFENFDLNSWWLNHHNRFPNLFKLYLKISSIPATSTPSERLFSIAGLIINDRRASLNPKTINDILIARNKYIT